MGSDFYNYTSILENFGESCYLFERGQFINNVEQMESIFKQYYPKVKLAHSYKTNYTPALGKIAREMGLYAEVVSGMEYQIALEVGYSPKRIIFNGPIKEEKELHNALNGNSLINIDHLSEVDKICEIATRNQNLIISVGIRCNADYGEAQRSRFGMSEDSGELQRAFRQLRSVPNIRINGIHIHTSAIRMVESYKRRAEFAAHIVRTYLRNDNIAYINLGGGMPSKMPVDLLTQLGMEQPNYEEYARAISKPLSDLFCDDKTFPELILEPGLAIFANVFRLCSKVLAVKKIKDRNIAILSCGVHTVKPTGHDLNMPVRHVPKSNKGQKGYWDLTGYTCMEHDIVFRNFYGHVEIGDIFIFDQVGAYTTTLKPPFILPAPAIVEVQKNAIKILRDKESVDQILSSYRTGVE